MHERAPSIFVYVPPVPVLCSYSNGIIAKEKGIRDGVMQKSWSSGTSDNKCVLK